MGFFSEEQLKLSNKEKTEICANYILNSRYFTPQQYKLAINYAKSHAQGEKVGCSFFPNYSINNSVSAEDLNKDLYDSLRPIFECITSEKSITNIEVFTRLNNARIWEEVFRQPVVGEPILSHSAGSEFIYQLAYFMNKDDRTKDFDPNEVQFIYNNAKEIFNEIFEGLKKESSYFPFLAWFTEKNVPLISCNVL